MSKPEHISVTLKQLLADREAAPVRHPVIRWGERETIPNLVRLSLYARDGRRCRECGLPHRDLELDHIVPWSAGGGDHTSNLRTLCQPCNQKRSNFRDVAEERLPAPTTWWCWHCWRHPEIEIDDPDAADWGGAMPFKSVWKDGTNPGTAPLVTDPTQLVYCATCMTYSYSNVLFSAEMQQRLVDLCAPAQLRTPAEQDGAA